MSATLRQLLAIMLWLPLGALALPDAVRERHAPEGGWQQWGSAEMTWYGLALYGATLWVGGSQQAGAIGDATPLALSLQYRRDIPGERIVRASVDEMRRLGASGEALGAWEADMRRIFPDVRKGDTLTGVFLPGRGARFFLNERDIGEVSDAEFARRFFAIWLDPRTRSPEVRAALLRPAAS